MPASLTNYMNDHWAGSTAGLELFRRVARSLRDTNLGPELAALAKEIDEDRETLRRLLHDLGVTPSLPRAAIGWIAEKAGRFKPNGRIVTRSPRSDVVELEALRVAVQAKRCGWEVLLQAADHEPRLDRGVVETLLKRAESQAERLARLHLQVARDRFDPGV